MNLDWRDSAKCTRVAPDLFFPETGEHEIRAKEVCQECPVREACLVHAILSRETTGVWGAMTAKERRWLTVKITANVNFEHIARSASLGVGTVHTIADALNDAALS